MKTDFSKILFIGLICLLVIIIAEVFQIRILSILGIINLAIVFVINSKILMRRIEKLENGS